MLITKEKITALQEMPPQDSLSLYIHTHRVGNADADLIRWKNACADALKLLELKGYEARIARKFLRPATDLLDDTDFWMHLSDGLCMFINTETTEYFTLPISFHNRVHLGTNFLLSPLMPFFKNQQRFFLLDLSLKHIRFFECGKHSITPVKIDDLIPISITETNIVEDLSPNIQQRGSGMYHGHGRGNDDSDTQLERYLRLVDKGMQEIYVDETAPLVLSGDSSITIKYKELTNYQNILEPSIPGNNEQTDIVELHSRAIQIVVENHLTSDNELFKEYTDIAHTPLAVKGHQALVKAIEEKNVAQVFVPSNFADTTIPEFLHFDTLIMAAEGIGAKVHFIDPQVMKAQTQQAFAIKHY